MNAETRTFADSPALKLRSRHYPERFNDRVPRRIKMLMTVRPDAWGFITTPPGTVAVLGEVYEAWTNSHGAVAAICKNGEVLGVKPNEFEVSEWAAG